MTPSRAFVAAWVGAASLLLAGPADAYRPFDGTDADVADLRDFELELGPTNYYRLGSQNFLISPALVLNFGIFEDTEIVVNADQYVALGRLAMGVHRVSVLEDDVLVKHVFRKGSLQGESGPSLAAEGGLLMPELDGSQGVGGSLDVITSYRWSCGALHWNEEFEVTREKHADLFTGVIVEGPLDWTVRPVAEVYYDDDFAADSTASALIGAIWTLRASFSLDAAVRGARVGGQDAAEVRLGLTWTIPTSGRAEANTARAVGQDLRPGG
jgi:hypothetical protein